MPTMRPRFRGTPVPFLVLLWALSGCNTDSAQLTLKIADDGSGKADYVALADIQPVPKDDALVALIQADSKEFQTIMLRTGQLAVTDVGRFVFGDIRFALDSSEGKRRVTVTVPGGEDAVWRRLTPPVATVERMRKGFEDKAPATRPTAQEEKDAEKRLCLLIKVQVPTPVVDATLAGPDAALNWVTEKEKDSASLLIPLRGQYAYDGTARWTVTY